MSMGSGGQECSDSTKLTRGTGEPRVRGEVRDASGGRQEEDRAILGVGDSVATP